MSTNNCYIFSRALQWEIGHDHVFSKKAVESNDLISPRQFPRDLLKCVSLYVDYKKNYL